MTRDTAFCVACDGKLSLFGQRFNYDYYRCCVCGTIQLFPLPDETDLAHAYKSKYATALHYGSDPEFCRISARTYYQSIINILKDYEVKGTILDYGAGWGWLCEMLIGEGFKCQGNEMSNDMVAYSQKRGLPVKYGGMEALEGQKFSAIVLCAVFEHLVGHDSWLAKARQLLKRGGLVITLQPTAKFAYFMGQILRFGNLKGPLPQLHQVFCPPWHTVLFSLDGMRTMVAKHGFSVLEIRPAPQGREKGVTGFAQSCLELVNRFGWHLIRESWPLVIAHTFVLRKMDDTARDPI